MARLRPRPGILEIEPYVGGKAEVAGIARAVKLSANRSPLGPSPHAIAALQAIASEAHRYPDGGAERLGARSAPASTLILSASCAAPAPDELIQLLMRAYAGPGDEVLYSAHGFLMYKLSALGSARHRSPRPSAHSPPMSTLC